MEFREDSRVYTWNNEVVGHIKRVVLDPVTKEVTHVVIRQGFLFTEDKVVPIGLFQNASKDRAVLRKDATDLDSLPRFEETHYVPIYDKPENHNPPEVTNGLLWYPPIGMTPYDTMTFYGAPNIVSHQPYEPDHPYMERTEENIPDGEVAVREGAKVISADEKHVGNVERVIVDEDSDYVTHIVISKGLLLRERKLIPVGWLSTVGEDEVHLGVDHRFVDELTGYTEQPIHTY